MAGSMFATLASFGAARGPALVDVEDLRRFYHMVLGAKNGITANAGGSIAAATPLTVGFNQLDTVATAADSALLPPAIMQAVCWVSNNGAASMNVYNSQANPQNGGASDVVIPHGSATANAGNAAVAVAVGHVSLFVCMKLGVWKQVADFA